MVETLHHHGRNASPTQPPRIAKDIVDDGNASSPAGWVFGGAQDGTAVVFLFRRIAGFFHTTNLFSKNYFFHITGTFFFPHELFLHMRDMENIS